MDRGGGSRSGTGRGEYKARLGWFLIAKVSKKEQ